MTALIINFPTLATNCSINVIIQDDDDLKFFFYFHFFVVVIVLQPEIELKT